MSAPTNKEQLEQLLTEINQSIEILKPKVECNKTKNNLITSLSIILGALITITLGFKISGYENLQKNLALCIGATLTIVNGWGASFDYKKLWIRQKSTLLDFYQLRNQLIFFRESDSLSNEDIKDMFERYQDIWERDSKEWRNIIYKSSKPTNKPSGT